jgi:hypothetical protein
MTTSWKLGDLDGKRDRRDTVADDSVKLRTERNRRRLRGFPATCELFFYRPVIVVANEDAMTIAVETERYAEAAQQAAEQAEIATCVFGGEEFGNGNFASDIVEEAEQGQRGPRSSSQR